MDVFCVFSCRTNRPSIDQIRCSDLKDMPVEDVVNSFDDYAVEMQNIFDVKQWESKLRPSKEFCYLALTQTLLTEVQMKAMVDQLVFKLTDPEKHGPIPVGFTDLLTIFGRKLIEINSFSVSSFVLGDHAA